jgi:DNA invertase Pin-like site-specific DNA recombinase
MKGMVLFESLCMLFGFGVKNGSGTDDTAVLEQIGCERLILVRDQQHAKLKLEELMQYLRPGDVLAVTEVGRLGADLEAILLAVERLRKLGATLRSEKCGIVPGTPFGNVFTEACGVLLDVVRGNLSEDVGKFAVGKGKRPKRGRPAVLSLDGQYKANKLLAEQKLSVPQVARMLKVSPATIYRYFPARRWIRDPEQSRSVQPKLPAPAG